MSGSSTLPLDSLTIFLCAKNNLRIGVKQFFNHNCLTCGSKLTLCDALWRLGVVLRAHLEGQARSKFQSLVGQNCIAGGQDFCYMFKKISWAKHIWGEQIIFGGNCPRMPLVATGLSSSCCRRFSFGSSAVWRCFFFKGFGWPSTSSRYLRFFSLCMLSVWRSCTSRLLFFSLF